MNNIDISQTRGYNELDGAMSSIRKQWLESIPIEKRLGTIPIEKRLAGIEPAVRKQWLGTIPVEEKLAGIEPAVRKQWLGTIPIKERLTGLEPEQILMEFAPEKRKKLREILFDD